VGTVRARRRSVGGVGGLHCEWDDLLLGGDKAREVGCLQWPVLKELQCFWVEGAGYRGLKRGEGTV
jgi:hypothetical protein